VRGSSQTPGYVGNAELQVFPFAFTKLFLDLRENVATQVLSHLIEISDLLQNSNLAGIRNRTEHARDDFPTATEMASMLDVVSSLTDRMQKNGSAPLSYVLLGSNVDAWGRSVREFGNYRGDTIQIYERGELVGTRLPRGPAPIIIVPLIKLGETEEVFRVTYTEPSEFREMWKGYPVKESQTSMQLANDKMVAKELEGSASKE
jgi:hypothetical protein